MIWSTSGDGVLAEGDGTDLNRMRAGFDQIMKQHPDPWNLNNFGRFACQARDWATVRQLIAVIGDKPITKAWHDDVEFFDYCKRESAKYVPRKSPW